MSSQNFNEIMNQFLNNSEVPESAYVRFSGKPKVPRETPSFKKLKDKRKHGIPASGKERDWGIPDIFKSKACLVETDYK